MNSFPLKNALLLISFALFSSCRSEATVTMPGIFGDHMVLQQGTTLPVWGWADPGEQVTVSFGGQNANATAAADGIWKVELPAVPASANPGVLTITGSNTLTFQDVLVGDVWIASGQSNMAFPIQNDWKGAEAISTADDSQIRLFKVPENTALEPQKDIAKAPVNSLEGKWQTCSPEVLRTDGETKVMGWEGFSALGYYFGREIHKATGRPIGIIGSYKGGTKAQSWTSMSGLEKDPALAAYYLPEHQKWIENGTQGQEIYNQKMTEYQAAQKQWTEVNDKSRPAPQLPGAHVEYAYGGPNAPGNLFNGMIAPLIPYAIKGVIWYQGEGNANTLVAAREYYTLFPRLISDWREKWGNINFPFLYVQLASYTLRENPPVKGTLPWLREAQLKALSLPNTGMATAIDIGNPKDVHSMDKFDLGLRLALVGRHIAYGEDIVSSGPLYDAMTIDGNKIRVTFKSVGGGLTPRASPWTPTGVPPQAPTKLTGFEIAGTDQKFSPAKASIDGATIVVFSGQVSQPVAVRYDWEDVAQGNLYNQEGLPAFPFRTDNWEPEAQTMP